MLQGYEGYESKVADGRYRLLPRLQDPGLTEGWTRSLFDPGSCLQELWSRNVLVVDFLQ